MAGEKKYSSLVAKETLKKTKTGSNDEEIKVETYAMSNWFIRKGRKRRLKGLKFVRLERKK